MSDEPQEPQAVAPDLFTGTILPMAFEVRTNPQNKMVALVCQIPNGKLTILMEASDESEELTELLKSSIRRARSGVVLAREVPKLNGGKGIVGHRR